MTAADVVGVLGYLMAASGAILGVWALVVRPWRYELPDDDLDLDDGPEVTPGDPTNP